MYTIHPPLSKDGAGPCGHHQFGRSIRMDDLQRQTPGSFRRPLSRRQLLALIGISTASAALAAACQTAAPPATSAGATTAPPPTSAAPTVAATTAAAKPTVA